MTTSTTTETPAAVETTETAGADITISVDAGPVTPDFDGCSRGWSAELILDPEDRTVVLNAKIGNGTPAFVWHNRAITLSVNESADGEAIERILEAHREAIDEAFETYEGASWDGHNMVGSWESDDDGRPLHEAILGSLQDEINGAPCYWSACDWLGGAWSECRRDLEGRIGDLGGEALAKKLGEVAEAWANEGASNDALLDADDVRKQIDRMVEELREGNECLWIVESGEATALNECEVQAAIDDLKNLGETWVVVEATSEYAARVAARAVREQGAGAGLATVRALLDSWNSDKLERIGEHLPA